MPRKDSSWIEESGLYGTWTFTTSTMTDAGYYKGIAYVVVHLMPDPMQVKSCVIEASAKDKTQACIEADNRACSHAGAVDNEKEVCVDTETTDLEWSDVTAFFQFGFRFRTGIVKKSYYNVHTSDWLGPYNMILAPIQSRNHTSDNPKDGNRQHDLYVSRYVTTPWTETELQRPFASSAIFNFDSEVLEDVVGTTAINETIHIQKGWRGSHKSWLHSALGDETDDPYSKYSRTCDHGDLRPILPKLEVLVTTNTSRPDNKDSKHPRTKLSMKLDYSMLSLPEKGIDYLYKLLPTMKKRLGRSFPLRGPYCYGKDPNRAYAIRLSYDSTIKSSTWKAIKGCDPSWPCWKGDPNSPVLPPSSMLPEDNHSEGSYILDPKGVEFLIIYCIGFVLFVSLIMNLQLANKLLKLRRNGSRGAGALNQPQQTRSAQPSAAFSTPVRSRGGGNITNDTSAVTSPNDYLQEAAGDRSSTLEEPLLTTSSEDDDQQQSGAEEYKQETE